MATIRINHRVSLDESEIELSFTRSRGPGGQNVNRVETAVELRFDAAGSPNLPVDVKARLLEQAKHVATQGGEIVIQAQRYRSQRRNRDDAIDRLINLIQHAAVSPVKRRKTRPTYASKQRRIETKKAHGQKKRLRRPPSPDR